MSGRSTASFLGFVGGLLVALSGLPGLVGNLLRSGSGAGYLGLISSFILALIAVVLGVILMILARPRLFWWGGRSLTTGIVLIVVAIVSWVILGGGLLLLLGVLLAVLAGVIFVVEEFTHRSYFRR